MTGASDDAMNANELLDHALGQTAGLERAERALAADPAAAEMVERLSRSMHLLLDDGEVFEPPPGLSNRTMQFVAEAARRRKTILDFAPSRVPFRWSDIAVAASIFMAGMLTLLPAAQRSRDRVDQAGCTYNLQQLGRALWLYGSQHKHYPFGSEVDGKAAPIGGYLAILKDNGDLTEAELSAMECPSHKKDHRHEPLPDYPTLCRLHAEDPNRVIHMLCTNYAYNPGHRSATSNKVVPIPADHMASDPLLGDQPPHENFRTILDGNSPNHGGRGQNVLYSDLHVSWHNTRRLSPTDPDMYLNNEYKIAPGVSPKDSILMPSLVPSVGW